MLYLFTSNSQERYKVDALLSLAYPRGHMVTFRYHERIVSPEVRKWPVYLNGEVRMPLFRRSAVIVYAHYYNESPFKFFPLRSAKLMRLWKRGPTYYAALTLRDYVNYVGTRQPDAFNETIEDLSFCPRPQTLLPKYDSEGYFMAWSQDKKLLPTTSSSQGPEADRPWQQICDSLVERAQMQDTVFWRLDGIHLLRGRFLGNLFGYEQLVTPTAIQAESSYRISMGRNYVLKMVSYVHKNAPKPNWSITVDSLNKDAAMITPARIQITSRYNEERMLLGCKRVLDRSLNPILIAAQDQANPVQPVLIPQGYILTQIEVPRTTILMILLLMMSASILLPTGPDTVKALGDFVNDRRLTTHAGAIAGLCKALGAVIGLMVGFIAFRRIPVGK
jgi:hypothetical protein